MTEQEKLTARNHNVYRAGLIAARNGLAESTIICSKPMSGFWYAAMKQHKRGMK